jgi:hypothetical protein
MAAAPRLPPYTKHNRQHRKPQTRQKITTEHTGSITEHQKTNNLLLLLLLFLTGRCSGLHKEIYEVLPVWAYPHRQCYRQQEKNPTINYPRIETSSDTMLRFVRGGKRWRLPLYII